MGSGAEGAALIKALVKSVFKEFKVRDVKVDTVFLWLPAEACTQDLRITTTGATYARIGRLLCLINAHVFFPMIRSTRHLGCSGDNAPYARRARSLLGQGWVGCWQPCTQPNNWPTN